MSHFSHLRHLRRSVHRKHQKLAGYRIPLMPRVPLPIFLETTGPPLSPNPALLSVGGLPGRPGT